MTHLFLFLVSLAWPQMLLFKILKDPKTGDNTDSLLSATLGREAAMRSASYNLISIFECEWKERVDSNDDIRQFVDGLDIKDRLKVRDAFFGQVSLYRHLHTPSLPMLF